MTTKLNNEILKTRLANPKDIDLIWNLYLKTNYLYPEKLAGMKDNGNEAKESLEKLLCCDDRTFRVCLCEDAAGNLLAVCSHGLFSDTNDWVMHMTCDHELSALMGVFNTSRRITKSSQADWVTWTFRPNNRSIQRLFTSALRNVNECAIENSIYDYFQLSPTILNNLADLPRALSVREATEIDRQLVISKLSHCSDRTALRSFGRFDQGFSINSVSARLSKLGLVRDRMAWVVEKNDRIGGIVIADVAPAWWNTSNLSTGFRFFLLKENKETFTSLISVSSEWLSQFKIPNWTMLLSPRETSIKNQLAAFGIVSNKKYQRLTMHRDLTDHVYGGYEDFMRRYHGGNNDPLYNGIKN